jgi:hypothetical protein
MRRKLPLVSFLRRLPILNRFLPAEQPKNYATAFVAEFGLHGKMNTGFLEPVMGDSEPEFIHFPLPPMRHSPANAKFGLDARFASGFRPAHTFIAQFGLDADFLIAADDEAYPPSFTATLSPKVTFKTGTYLDKGKRRRAEEDELFVLGLFD